MIANALLSTSVWWHVRGPAGGAVPRRDRRLCRARSRWRAPAHPRPQGRRGSGRWELVVAALERACVRVYDIPAGDRGHRHRPRLPLPAGPAPRGRGVGRAAQLVPDQRRIAGKPRRMPRAPPRGPRVVVRSATSTRAPSTGSSSAGLGPAFVAPELDPELGIAHCLTPESLARRSTEPGVVAAFTVSPTYFGAVADVRGLAEVAHSHGVPLVVDEAWGAHLRFSPELPDERPRMRGRPGALLGAQDCSAASPSRRSCTWAGTTYIDADVIDRCVTLTESTSPSALLTASLDAARRQAAVSGAELLARNDCGGEARPRGDPRDSRASRSSTSASSGAPASTRGTRCGSRWTCAGRGAPGPGSGR